MTPYTIKHITRYTYDSTVIDCTNQVMLYPITDQHLEVKKHDIVISGNPAVEIFTDYFGNQVGVFSLVRPHDELVIESTSEVITKKVALPVDEVSAAEQWQHLHSLKNTFPYLDFLSREHFASLGTVRHEMEALLNENDTPFENAKRMMEYVYTHFKYTQGVTTVETSPEEIWKMKAGVCQDFAHILLVMLRMADIPGRYVSGYVCPPKDKEVRGSHATHAWVEVYVPWYGWLGLDPTNNCVVNDQHVRLATGRSFLDCTPVKGTYKGSGAHTLEVSVDIENGSTGPKTEPQGRPIFNYTQTSRSNRVNSYRHYLEMQQQQIQQQQQQQQQ